MLPVARSQEKRVVVKVRKDKDDDTIDDLSIGYLGDAKEKIIGVHLERMDAGYYWLCVDLDDGRTIHVDIYKPTKLKRTIRARLR